MKNLCTPALLVLVSLFLLCGVMSRDTEADSSGVWRVSDLSVTASDAGDQSISQANLRYEDAVTVVSPDAVNGEVVSGHIYKVGDTQILRSGDGSYYAKRSGDTLFRLMSNSPFEGERVTFPIDSDIVVSAKYINEEDLAGSGVYYTVYPSIRSAIKAGEVSREGVVVSLVLDKSQQRTLLPLPSTSSLGHEINSIVYSQDGHYALARVENTSLVKINLLNQQATVIATRGLFAAAPLPGAVTNDGRAAVNAVNTEIFSIINCGDSFDSEYVGGVESVIRRPCSSYSMGEMIHNETAAEGRGERYVFKDNDDTLESLNDVYPAAISVKVSIHGVSSFKKPRLSYLALGDSYSSGEGDLGKRSNGLSYYINGTDQSGCHLSSRSYPFILRDTWGISSGEMKSVACAGAKVLPDYYGTFTYYGQNYQYRAADYTKLTNVRKNALEEFTPGQIRQLEFVREYRPDRITFTGGGNDVGFADIIEYCASSYRLFGKIPTNETCAYVYDSQLRANLNSQIDTQYVFNKKFIEEVRRVSPQTEIYMVGYPQFVKADADWCFRGSGILNNNEIKFIRQSLSRLNNTLKRVARDTGVYYIDIEDSLEGGQICQGSKYMTGPVRAIVKNGSVRKDPNMYHPNAAGHHKLAERIADQIAKSPEYEVVDIPAEEDASRVIHQAVLPAYTGIGSTQTITMGPGFIKADGTTSIEMFSNKVHIGDYKTDATGALKVQVTIPQEVGIGMHLLTISGVDADDQPVQVQQFIYVTSNNPNDIDLDGIPNESDNCFSTSEWYVDGVNQCAASADRAGENLFAHGRQTDKSGSEVVDDAFTSARSIVMESSDAATGFTLAPSQYPFEPTTGTKASDANQKPELWLIFPIMLIIAAGILYYGKCKK